MPPTASFNSSSSDLPRARCQRSGVCRQVLHLSCTPDRRISFSNPSTARTSSRPRRRPCRRPCRRPRLRPCRRQCRRPCRLRRRRRRPCRRPCRRQCRRPCRRQSPTDRVASAAAAAAAAAARAASNSSSSALPRACRSATSKAANDLGSVVKCCTCLAHQTAYTRISLSNPSTARKHHKVSSRPLESRTVNNDNGSSSALVFPR
jgi:hypothetical protein